MRALLFSVFISALSFGSVNAGTPSQLVEANAISSDCTTTIDNLTAVTSGAGSLSDKERSGLIKISTDANNLFLIGKTSDALKKLYDYQVKLDQLAATLNNPKPKISVSDEQLMREALNQAIACLTSA